MSPRLLAVGQARGQRAEQDRDHLIRVGAAHHLPGDPPQVELVRGRGRRASNASGLWWAVLVGWPAGWALLAE
jgi:hypothetical protein